MTRLISNCLKPSINVYTSHQTKRSSTITHLVTAIFLLQLSPIHFNLVMSFSKAVRESWQADIKIITGILS